MVGVGGGLLWSLRSPAEPLDADRLAAARERWERRGPSDYALELELSGALSDRRRIVVRDGEVVEMTTSGVFCEIRVYPGAGHAFFNETREAYDPDAAMAAWERTLEWFHEYL